MGSGGAKETNRLLGEQQRRSNTIADTAAGRSEEQYNQVSGLPNEILGNYRDIYAGIGEGGGGGGGGLGPGYKPADFESEALPFYLKMMKEGGYSEADKANILSYATGPITGMFDAVKRRLETAGRGRGMPSYGGGFADITRDKAYAASDMAKGVAADLAERVLGSRFQGAAGTRGIETEKRAFEAQERARKLRAAQARASAGRASNAQQFSQKMSVLDAMGNYRPGTDLDYMDRNIGATGQATNAVGGRANETPLWQRALTSLPSAAAGAAIGSFSNPFKKKPSSDTAYWDERSP